VLTRRGALVEEQDSVQVADDEVDSDDRRPLRPLHAAGCTCRIAFGARAGQSRGKDAVVVVRWLDPARLPGSAAFAELTHSATLPRADRAERFAAHVKPALHPTR
jgi:hypothetical protein